MKLWVEVAAAALLLSGICGAECIPIEHAKEHVGDNVCVTGKVLKVTESRGVRFLNFCEDYRVCPFTVVVFNRDLRDVGDIYRLAGRTIEVHGVVKLYDSRPEIILKRPRQLTGEAAHIPALPKDFDVERKGKYSAGTFSYPKSPRKTSKQTSKKDSGAPADWSEQTE
jgi:DNA/RNA endonuclease YhcR with UshA esterase domain